MEGQKKMSEYHNIPKMVPIVVQDYLYVLGSSWKGIGTAVELGSWLGGTAVPLLEGLKEAHYNKPFYAYDKWKVNKEQVSKALLQGVKLQDGQNSMSLFLENTNKIQQDVIATRGRFSDTLSTYNGGPIEICIFDAPKQEPIFTHAIKAMCPYWIPGVTIVGLLDYYFYRRRLDHMHEKFKAPVKFMERYGSSFEKIIEWPEECSCVFFKYTKPLNL